MSDTPLPPLPSTRRALVIYYDDTLNEVEVDARDFTWLELPELLRVALDFAEYQLPSFDLETEGAADE